MEIKASEHFHKEYHERKDEEGSNAKFDICKICGDIITQGRYDAAKQSTETRSSKAATKDKDCAQKEAAKYFFGLISGAGSRSTI